MTGFKALLFPWLAGLCWAAFAYKVRDVRRRPADPALRALLVAFAVKGIAFLLAVPGIAAAVDRRTGVPDASALGIHLLGGVAFGAAVLVALVYWAHPPEQAGPRARRRLCAAGLVSGTMVALWAMVEAGTDHRSPHYLLQNANRPLVTLYLCLYVGTLLVALGEITRLCLHFAPLAADRWLRRGLRCTAAGALVYSMNFWSRAITIVAVRAGLNPLDWEIVIVVGAGVGVPLIVGGLTLPGWGPRLARLSRSWAHYRLYRRLRPLWCRLRAATPGIALPAAGWSLSDVDYRLHRRVIEIRDGLLALRPYHDAGVAERARAQARAAGLTGDDLRAVVAAAQLRAALEAKGQDRAVRFPGREDAVGAGAFMGSRGTDVVSEAAWLARIGRVRVDG